MKWVYTFLQQASTTLRLGTSVDCSRHKRRICSTEKGTQTPPLVKRE